MKAQATGETGSDRPAAPDSQTPRQKSLNIEELTQALEQERMQGLELVAWRNTFPAWRFNQRTGRMEHHPELLVAEQAPASFDFQRIGK